MAKTTIKVTGDTVTNMISFEYSDSLGKDVADYLNGLVKEAKAKGDGLEKAVRYEQLAKDTQDRELARYYAELAKEAREGKSAVNGNATKVKEDNPPKAAKSAPRLPAAFAGRGIDNSPNQMAVESAKRAMLAQAESEENQAAICDRAADAAHESLLRAPSDLVSYYSAKKAEHRRKAQEHRDAAQAHRRAAEGI